LEQILALLERLVRQSSRGTPIVVEGRKDIQALRRLGVCGEIVEAKSSGKSFLDVVGEIERMEKREIILLLDFDRAGREWTRRLARCLEGVRITPNLFFWKRLIGLVGRDVKDVEGLVSYLETLRSRGKS